MDFKYFPMVIRVTEVFVCNNNSKIYNKNKIGSSSV